jgi:hypothetical protein
VFAVLREVFVRSRAGFRGCHRDHYDRSVRPSQAGQWRSRLCARNANTVLLDERYPEPLWSLQHRVIGWQARLLAFLASLIEPHPPFSLDTGTPAPLTA